LGQVSRRSIVIWGFVNHLPIGLEAREGFYTRHVWGTFVHDEHRFLLALHRRHLKDWLQELALYHGTDLRGLIQILPTTGAREGIAMGTLLCRAVHLEGRFAMDQLRVRFFSAPYQLMAPHTRDREGTLTFEAGEFLSLLEMATVFRTLLNPQEQEWFFKLAYLKDPHEEQFYWGRFMGLMGQEAKDMLEAWRMRQWPRPRIKLLYELMSYVDFYRTR